ncbi:peptide ABC transporter substrate-binding protein [Haloferax mediterranei ATCC 33500]|uniref:ABC-type dipeptide/oligopeptide/nickel transport system, substrate binding protein n=1 Tax=Haloferax mediterranei (strain ATCC 33500 / DSM 1411 / JCM 8866 / NBRC 14739 / NCIMB 2177 / R-4) TaxID=523841 RepID=I3R7C1_HALMT|nr:ABC transporter substrate-binding protein [Haloferax mediterranei]AFK20131.1 ABC-type dipeptide/oligopeptide/nickel transport system, substrate binding protein [Haloferax mediterranei ATCC 33500]AHZ23504.1 peptide ABC transporter substrate-binding protein [Haloferax mediterranei ATCC 33500]ELZ99678.1 ABC-type dipeptide/oligopeptide/nickel transport system, substrate binding protein [Haloferax mediterranei ATCC 33500]MDX5987118.1 ABC transporter substrate-binding protein [Haloferax mediterran
MADNNSHINRRSYLKLAGGAAASAALAGCTGDDGEGTETTTTAGGGNETETTTTPSENGDTFDVTITQGQMPSGLDPHDHRETPTTIVVLHAYEGVLTRDADGAVQTALATNYERIEGENAVRFDLREGVTFHNGDELTPEDVAYSINRVVDEEVGFASPQSDQLAGVAGAEAIEGENAVKVNNDGLNPIVFSEFATYLDVMQQSWVENNDKSYIAQNVNGTGPFKLDSYTEDEVVVFSAYEEYWQERAAVDTLTFRAASEASTRVNQLLQGETDVIVNVPPQEVSRINNSDNASIAAAPSTRIIYNGLRYDLEPFDSVKFRQALNYAIDLESIVQNILGGFGAQTGQPTLPEFVGHNPDIDPYPYDPDMAEQLVEESGYAGAEIELNTPVGRYLKDLEVAQAVVGYIDELPNVTATVRQRDFGSLVDELLAGSIEKRPPWFLIGWGEATFDGGLVMEALLASDGTLTTWKNDEFDSLLEQAGNQSGEEREATLQEANALAHEQAPWIFLNQQFSVYGVNNAIKWEPRSDERIDAYAMSQP